MEVKKQCSIRVSGGGQWGSFHLHLCQRPATIEVDGKWYCAIHNPEAVKGREQKREAIRKAKGCSKCGGNLERWWSYCPNCGTKIGVKPLQ